MGRGGSSETHQYCEPSQIDVPGNRYSQLKIALLLLFVFINVSRSSDAAENLPVTPAETLSGQKLQFPTALTGKLSVCVFGFSKEAGDRTKTWMTRLNQDGMNAWSIANLEKAPAMVRGMIRGSMRKGTPAPQQDRSLIMTKDETAWKRALRSTQDNLPVVVLLDPSGRVLWTYEGVFRSDAYGQLKSNLAAAPK